MNRVILVGNLTKDPEFKNIGTTHVANFGLALNRRTRNGQETTFVEVSAFSKTAENIAKYFTKGKPILIEGRLQQDAWQDKVTGAKRSKLKVIAESFEFVGGAPSQNNSAQSATSFPTVAPPVPDTPFV